MPKIVNHEQYRKELLSKCFDLFAEKGYGSITMRNIAEGLGVSTGTLYHYFPSKRALFELMVEETVQENILIALALVEGKKTLQERLEAFADYIETHEETFIKQTYVWVDFFHNQDSKESQNNGLWKRIDARYQEAIDDMLGITDPVITDFIGSLIDGIILEKVWGNERICYREQLSLLGKMLTLYLEKTRVL
jgi:AcrR family transcriptional regulator